MNHIAHQSTLTGVFIKETDGRFTAFFSEIPEANAQGEDFEEAERNLIEILPDVLEFKNELNEEYKIINGIPNELITRKSYNFQLSA